MDDFDEIFDKDEALDCALLEEIENEQGPKKNSNQGGGCLGTLIIFCGVLSTMFFGVTKFIIA